MNHNDKEINNAADNFFDDHNFEKYDMLVPVNKLKIRIDNCVRDYCAMNDQEVLTSDDYRNYMKFMMKKTAKVNKKRR